MKRTFSNLWIALFPPVGRKAALRITAEACRPATDNLEIYSGLPPNTHLYNTPSEPFWCIRAPWGDGKYGTMLRSSLLTLVSKRSGEILYAGSANDEG